MRCGGRDLHIMKIPVAYSELLDSLFDGVYVLDQNRMIVYWNKAAEHITGYAKEEVVGRNCTDDILSHVDASGCSLCKNGCPVSRVILTKDKLETTVFLKHKQGHRIKVMVRCSPVHFNNGMDFYGVVESFSESQVLHAAESELEIAFRAAMTDHLTALYNRRFVEALLDSLIEDYRRYHHRFGVLLFDLDFFKRVNDSYGHLVGDRVLMMVSNTLKRTSRSSDVVGRWGGEEFVCVCKEVETYEQLMEIGDRFRTMIEASRHCEDDIDVGVTVSIGGGLFRQDDSYRSFYERIDKSLYRAKDEGRNRLVMLEAEGLETVSA